MMIGPMVTQIGPTCGGTNVSAGPDRAVDPVAAGTVAAVAAAGDAAATMAPVTATDAASSLIRIISSRVVEIGCRRFPSPAIARMGPADRSRLALRSCGVTYWRQSVDGCHISAPSGVPVKATEGFGSVMRGERMRSGAAQRARPNANRYQRGAVAWEAEDVAGGSGRDRRG